MTVTLATLTHQTGLTVLGHLEQSISIPVVEGPQAQGDLLVIPYEFVRSEVRLRPALQWHDVPSEGVELLRGEAGGNPHSLVAEPRTCRWTPRLFDALNLGIAAFEALAPVYLLHPEHGATGCAPGTYVVRRQREHGRWRPRMVAD
ncbi:hypothetical protein J5X84_02025 [Streptosporangiaceae bacterium NEAU-GS5]|nr:hypothetical protein [Streptosporangiaceae bacterium NEAU-GS5]